MSCRAVALDLDVAAMPAEKVVMRCTRIGNRAHEADAGHRQQFADLLKADLRFAARDGLGHANPLEIIFVLAAT